MRNEFSVFSVLRRQIRQCSVLSVQCSALDGSTGCFLLKTAFRRVRREAFTLVELLVTIIIIGILTSLVLGALVVSQESANRARTESIITKLDTALAHRWESYKTRRIQLDSTVLGAIPANDRDMLAQERTRGLYELMRFELPQRWDDITREVAPSSGAAMPVEPLVLDASPSISAIYLRAYNQVKTATGSWPSDDNQAAECLYLIMTLSNLEDESFTEQVGNLDQGDIDGDGMKEFHDAWGNPITFLRWAPGFVSLRQTRNPKTQHDPFDSLHQFDEHYALSPLIFSPGPDGIPDIIANNNADTPITGTPPPYPTQDPEFNDPYDGWTNSSVTYLPGESNDTDNDGDDNSIDNIYNHNLQVR